jgi:hypothetical protein
VHIGEERSKEAEFFLSAAGLNATKASDTHRNFDSVWVTRTPKQRSTPPGHLVSDQSGPGHGLALRQQRGDPKPLLKVDILSVSLLPANSPYARIPGQIRSQNQKKLST